MATLSHQLFCMPFSISMTTVSFLLLLDIQASCAHIPPIPVWCEERLHGLVVISPTHTHTHTHTHIDRCVCVCVCLLSVCGSVTGFDATLSLHRNKKTTLIYIPNIPGN